MTQTEQSYTINIMKFSPNFVFFSVSTLMYAIFSIALLMIDNNTRLFASTDPYDYINSARGFFSCGGFAYLESCLPKVWNTPGYPIYISIFMFFFSNYYIDAVIISQILLLLITSIIYSSILKKYSLACSKLIYVIILFNPNSFFSAQLIQTETLFTFFISFGIWIMHSQKGIWPYIVTGIIASLCAYVRPAFFYFTYISPIIIFLIAIKKHNLKVKKGLILSLLTFIIILVLNGYWLERNNNYFGKHTFVANAGYQAWENILELAKHSSRNYELVFSKYENIFSKIIKVSPDYQQNQTPKSSEILMSEAIKEFQNFKFNEILLVGLRSIVNLFFSGGGSNIERLISGNDHSSKFINQLFYGNIDSKEIKINLEFLCHLFAVLFAFVLRIFGIVGFIMLILKKQYWLISVSLFPIFYMTPLYGFIGQSRFRVPLEPSLAILSAVGLVATYLLIKNKYYMKF